MIIGIGSDIVDIARIEAVLKKFPQKFLKRVFTQIEQETAHASSNSSASYAKRFAAKEAFVKALGTGFRQGLSWQDIEVINLKNGQPSLNLKGKAQKLLRQLSPQGMTAHIHLSISDSRTLAHAMVVISMLRDS
ncbi:MAG: holo-ACP synthase [Alphaproteobacteria bacterium]|nr:holo-ACP synthase [Alphaproteobacteria bacterium]